MKKIWFILGRETLLSAAELYALLPRANLRISGPIGFYSGPEKAEDLMKRLGGTIKIGVEIANDLSLEELKNKIIADLLLKYGKLVFGLSSYVQSNNLFNVNAIKNLGYEIKNSLKASERSARLIIKDSVVLPGATIQAEKLVERASEYLIYQEPETKKFALAKTVALHPFAEWGERDFGRPGRDAKSGMLPPKLARMMLNISGLNLNSHILDPFCGSGTIITEAMLLGFNKITGSDLSDTATRDSETNVNWIKNDKNLNSSSEVSIMQADVRDLPRKISNQSIDGITTEPFLGPPLRGNEKPSELALNAAALSELYTDAFASFSKILKSGATVIFIFPQINLCGKIYRTAETVLPKIKKLGFMPENLLPKNITSDLFVLYRRPDQFVGREIWKFNLYQDGTGFKFSSN